MARRGEFADSWWGRAWINALEGTARLDPNRLGRGRTYARQGAVGALLVEPGHVTARVSGSHGRYYRVDVSVRMIPSDAWDRVVDVIAAKAAHAAALAAGDLDERIVDDVAAAGVALLPGAGDLRPQCGCPDWAEPCKHAAAVCYLVAAEFDRDPFLLFLLRGISGPELLERVAHRRRGDAVGDASARQQRAQGVVAREAWVGHDLESPFAPSEDIQTLVAANSHAPKRWTRPMPWEVVIDAADPVDPARTDDLAADASRRAWEMLADGAPSRLLGTPRGDIARAAARTATPRELASIASATRVRPSTLSAWAQAWRLGGDAAVEVIADEDSWSIDQARLAAGRDILVELGIQRRSVALNYDSLGMPKGIKLVIGPDGRWYRLHTKKGEGSTEPIVSLTGAPSAEIADVVYVDVGTSNP